MDRRIWNIVGTLIILLVPTALFFGWFGQHRSTSSYTNYNDYAAMEKEHYFSENRGENAYLYHLSAPGRVKGAVRIPAQELQSRVQAIAAFGNELYVINAQLDSHAETTRRVQVYSSGLTLTKESPAFELRDDSIVTDLYVDESGIYLTVIAKNGKEIDVYQIPSDAPVKVAEDEEEAGEAGGAQTAEAAEEKPLTLNILTLCEAEPGRFFVDATYDGFAISGRTDADGPEGFTVSEDVRTLFDQKKIPTMLEMKLIGDGTVAVLTLIVVCSILLAIAYAMLGRKSNSIQTILGVEILLTFLFVGVYLLATDQITERAGERRDSLLGSAMTEVYNGVPDVNAIDPEAEGFYESAEYLNLQAALGSYVESGSRYGALYDVAVFSLNTGEVEVSATGVNRQKLQDIYGTQISDLYARIQGGADRAIGPVRMNGVDMLAGLMYSKVNAEPKYGLICIMDNTILTESLEGTQEALRRILVILYIIIAALFLITMLIRYHEMSMVREAVSELADGRTDIRKPSDAPEEQRLIWSGLSEISKRMDQMNYSRYRLYEAYYRFSPKKIEQLLSKESITEVHCGDVTQMSGDLAILSLGGKQSPERILERTKNLMEIMGKDPDYPGILVSQNHDLSVMELYFHQGRGNALRTCIELMLEQEKNNLGLKSSMLLYHAGFTYGIAGSKEHSVSFLLSEHHKTFENYSEWLRTMRVRLTITEEVLKNEGRAYETRYIGYVAADAQANSRLKLYEVLDACPSRERQIKIRTRDRFEEALKLFYEGGYYPARNLFSEVLKELPQDEIVKWYLFESEKYLGTGSEIRHSGALHLS